MPFFFEIEGTHGQHSVLIIKAPKCVQKQAEICTKITNLSSQGRIYRYFPMGSKEKFRTILKISFSILSNCLSYKTTNQTTNLENM